MNRPHTFAGNPLDRTEHQRRDASWLAARERDRGSRFLPLRQLDVLLEGEDPARLAWVSGNEARVLVRLAGMDLARRGVHERSVK